MSEPELEGPQEGSQVDVTLITRGRTLTARVEMSGASVLVVRPLARGIAQDAGVKPGDPVEVYWRGEFEERTLPAQVSDVEGGTAPVWHLEITGPSETSKRRQAVRAHVDLPVRIVYEGSGLAGETVDLSEAGMRVVVDGWGLPPGPGHPVVVDLALETDSLQLHGVIVRYESRAGRWQLAVRFDGVSEQDSTRLRRRVFQALREERARVGD
jgi:hypothetical protein